MAFREEILGLADLWSFFSFFFFLYIYMHSIHTAFMRIMNMIPITRGFGFLRTCDWCCTPHSHECASDM